MSITLTDRELLHSLLAALSYFLPITKQWEQHLLYVQQIPTEGSPISSLAELLALAEKWLEVSARRQKRGRHADQEPPTQLTRKVLKASVKALQTDVRFQSLPASLKRIAHLIQEMAAQYNQDTLVCFAQQVHAGPELALVNSIGELHAALSRWLASAAQVNTKSRILVVSQDVALHTLAKQHLQQPEREFYGVDNMAEATDLCQEHLVSMVILDMDDPCSYSLLVRLKLQTDQALLPLVLAIGSTAPYAYSESLALGADFYLQKPVDTLLLSTIVARGLFQYHKAVQWARLDPLTGLMAVRIVYEEFERFSALINREQMHMSLGLLQLDSQVCPPGLEAWRWQEIQLKHVAALLLRHLRKSDLVARLDQDRFVVLLPETDEIGAVRALEKLLALIRIEPIAHFAEAAPLTFSAGVTQASKGLGIKETLQEASQALEQGLKQGPAQIWAAHEEEAEGDWQPEPQAYCVAVADDDPLATILIKHRLEKWFRVLHFPDGATALEALKTTQAAVLILDVKMPGLDGFSVLKQLRKEPLHRHTPVIMLTSMGKESDISLGFDLGADDYMLKPFSPVELESRVKRLIRRKLRSQPKALAITGA